MSDALQGILNDSTINGSARAVTRRQLEALTRERGEEDTTVKEDLEKALDSWRTEMAHKQWVSFQGSIKVIASRIPAQSMQSFMAMKIVAWTKNRNNMCYVSHIQFFLQGSDLDIDKAYIMRQNYDSSGIYIEWSPYFDYTSLATLEASKDLPIPKGVTVTRADNDPDAADLTPEIDILNTLYGEPDEKGIKRRKLDNESDRLLYLKLMRSALLKLEHAGGKYKYSGELPDIGHIEWAFKNHESYQVNKGLAEGAYKNVASSNIYAISHDIRNRDHAYTPTDTSAVGEAADASPMSGDNDQLNLLNPLAKYVIQTQNVVAKDVVDIFVSGEKFWFNAYYYWTKSLREGKSLQNLPFHVKLDRVLGRATGNPEGRTIRLLPDLDERNPETVKSLEKIYEMLGDDTPSYKAYVNRNISNYTSSATDNAKYPKLGKINCNRNYAKMHLFLSVMGCTPQDIGAFMTSPAASLILSLTANDRFQNDIGIVYPRNAMKYATGRVSSMRYLKGFKTINDEAVGGEVSIPYVKAVKDLLLEKMPPALLERVETRLEENKKPSLDDIMQVVILEMSLMPESRTDNVTIWIADYNEAASKYAWYCDDMILRLREAVKQYGGGQEGLNMLMADIDEFSRIYELADEIPSISGGWLSLNQGLPSNKAELVLKLRYMVCIVNDRERRLGIKGDAMFTGIFADFILKATVKSLWELHPEYDEEYVENTLQDAYDQGVMNNFDIVKCLTDKEYWNATREYLNLLKGTVNALALLEANENYMEILHALQTQLTIDSIMSAKSRFANQVVRDMRYLKREQVEDALKFSEKLFVLEFLQGLPPVSVALDDRSSASVFDMFFRNITTLDFDLGTAEGIAGFRRFVETDFLGWLREKYPDNGLVRHLVLSDDRRGRMLRTGIDLRNPEVSRDSVIAYNNIMNGTALLGGKAYQQHSDGIVMMTDYTVSDILQLYNLVVNSNRYGSTMFTTVFQDAADDPRSLLGKYFMFINSRDSNMSDLEYDNIDYLISTVPIVSEYGLRYHSEPFVKVKDDVWGYKVMVNIGDSYNEYNMLKDIRDDEPVEERDARRAAFVRYCPFEMPVRFGVSRDTRVLNYSGEPDIEALAHTIANLERANKILVLKDCGAMGCGEILRVNGKDSETGKKAYTDIVLFKKEGHPVEQDTLLTMTDVAEYITRIEEKDWELMADAVADSFALPVTYKTLNSSPIVGNATPESLLNEFNLQGISLGGVTRRYNILRCSKIKSGKQEITGRVIDGNGQPVHVVTDLKSARKFLNYVLAQKQADESFGDDGDILEEAGLPGEMADDLRAVAKHFKKMPKDLYMAWLDNNGAFPSYNTGNTIVRPNVLMQRMSKWLMYGRWMSTLTDFEQERYGIGKVNRNFQWRNRVTSFMTRW